MDAIRLDGAGRSDVFYTIRRRMHVYARTRSVIVLQSWLW